MADSSIKMSPYTLACSGDKDTTVLGQAAEILALLRLAVVAEQEKDEKMDRMQESLLVSETERAALLVKLSDVQAKLQAAEAQCQVGALRFSALDEIQQATITKAADVNAELEAMRKEFEALEKQAVAAVTDAAAQHKQQCQALRELQDDNAHLTALESNSQQTRLLLESAANTLKAELEAERSKSSSAAETIQDLQQQLGVMEQALYQKQEMTLSWADHSDLAEALSKVEQLKSELQQAKEAAVNAVAQAELRSAGQTNTAVSMTRALQLELNFWRSQRSVQHMHSYGMQRGGSSSSSTWCSGAPRRFGW